MIESKTTIDIQMTGRKLRQYASKCGYSVKDIQNYLRLSCPQPVYRWFNGVILPSVDNLLRLSELFCVHMEDLLVKQSIHYDYEYYSVELTDTKQLFKRVQAYCSLLSA